MFEKVNKEKIKPGSEKGFGYVFGTFFIILSMYPILHNKEINLFFLIISIFFFFFTFTVPKIFKYPNIAWFWFGILLSKIVNPIILAFLYFIVVTPIGIFIKFYHWYKNNNYYKIDINKTSYWIERKLENKDFRDQF